MRRGRALRRRAGARPSPTFARRVARRGAGERLGGRCGVAQLRRNGGWFAARRVLDDHARRRGRRLVRRLARARGDRRPLRPRGAGIAARRTIQRGAAARRRGRPARRVRARNRGAPAERPAAMFCIPTRCRRRVSSLPGAVTRGRTRPVDAASTQATPTRHNDARARRPARRRSSFPRPKRARQARSRRFSRRTRRC